MISMHIYLCIYIYIYMYVCIYIYIYIYLSPTGNSGSVVKGHFGKGVFFGIPEPLHTLALLFADHTLKQTTVKPHWP